MKRRSVSITGATGFLGFHLAESFRDAGWRVSAVVRPGTAKPLPEGVERVQAPLAGERLAAAFEGSDVVVHSAALVRAPREAAFDEVNVEGTRSVVRAVNDVGASLIHISSLAVSGSGTADRPSREDDLPRPLTAYGRSKLRAELIVRSDARTSWTILRPCAVYGPRDRGFLPLFRLAKRGLFFLTSSPSTPLTLLYAADLARAIVLAASQPLASGQTLFVGHPSLQTTGDVLAALAAACGRTYRPRRVPLVLLEALARMGELSWMLGARPLIDKGRLIELQAPGFVCSVDRIRDALGFTASVPLREGFERTATWYREQGWM